MIRCIIVDDEIPALRYLQTLLLQLPEVELVKTFNNSNKCAQEIDSLDFNTCILDIHMPAPNGLELAKMMSGKAIIFSTAFKEFAADAFDLHAVDYLRKPYQLPRLAQAMDKVQHWLSTQAAGHETIIELNTAVGKSRIDYHNICYIEVADHDRRDKFIYQIDGSSMLAKNISMDELLALLPKHEFCRVNRKTIVSIAKVGSYTAQLISMQRNHNNIIFQTALSSAYKNEFLKLISI